VTGQAGLPQAFVVDAMAVVAGCSSWV
jgi:hypothetical protein